MSTRRIRVNVQGRSFEIRTASPRRYLVVDVRGQYVVLRTDNPTTAERKRRQDPARRVVVDTRQA